MGQTSWPDLLGSCYSREASDEQVVKAHRVFLWMIKPKELAVEVEKGGGDFRRQCIADRLGLGLAEGSVRCHKEKVRRPCSDPCKGTLGARVFPTVSQASCTGDFDEIGLEAMSAGDLDWIDPDDGQDTWTIGGG